MTQCDARLGAIECRQPEGHSGPHISRAAAWTARGPRLRVLEDDQAEHDCHNGWTGEDDRGAPIPCRRCRPWFYECRRCGSTRRDCLDVILRTAETCCPDCTHKAQPGKGPA